MRSRTPSLIACVVAAAIGWCGPRAVADPPEVHTDRPEARHLSLPEEEGVFHFVVYGDRTGGPAEGIKVLAQAVKDTNLLGPDLVMTVGDLVQGYNELPQWRAQAEEYRRTMNALEMPWFPVAGNHDIYWRGSPPPAGHHEADYEREFGPLWYWFGHKNAAFVVLFSDEGDPARNRKGWDGPAVNRMSAEQLSWLARTLEETRSFDHVFVFLHHPRWIAGTYPGTNWDAVHDLLRKAGNVTAVFAGHIHRQRYDGVRDGIEYVTLATTGGGTPFSIPGTGYLHHLNVVTVRKDRITMATIPVGTVLDPREMTPERWREIDLLRALPVREAGDGLAFDTDGRCRGTCGVRVKNPCGRPIAVTVEASSREPAWIFAPDHLHSVIPPGVEKTFAFAARREPAEAFEGLTLPRITVQADWLGETQRVSLPAHERPVGLGRVTLPNAALQAGENRCLRLTGAAGCLSVPTSTFRVPDGPFTLEGWLKADDYKGRRGFLAKTQDSEYGLFVSNATPSFSVLLGESYVTASASAPILEAGRWHHLAGVYDGSEVRLYVDGRLVGAAVGAGALRRNDLPFLIGADPDARGVPTSYFDGWIDEVRLSVGARYAGGGFPPARRFEPDEDTLLLLHLDKGLGSIAPDASRRGQHAIAEGRVEYVAAD